MLASNHTSVSGRGDDFDDDDDDDEERRGPERHRKQKEICKIDV